MMSRRMSPVDFVCLLAVLAVAFGARSWYLLKAADRGASSGPLQVQDDSPVLSGLPKGTEMQGHIDPNEQDALVHNLREHRWFGSLAPLAPAEEQTAHVAPGYYWLLSWLYLGPASFDPVDRSMRWIQAGLGAATCVLYFLFLRRAFSDLFLATLCGLLTALYPLWIINVAELSDGVVASFLLALVLYLSGRAAQRGGPLSSVILGGSLAALCLVRAAMLPFSLAVMVWFLFRCRKVTQGWLCGTLALLGFAGGEAFWSYRNFRLFHDVVPVVDSTFLHLWMGHNAAATGGMQTEQTMVAELARLREEDPTQVMEELASLPQKERYDRLASAVWTQMRRDPAGMCQGRLLAGASFLLGEEWLRSRALSRARAHDAEALPTWLSSFLPAALAGSLLFMLVFSFLGWRWSYGMASELAPSSLAILWIPLPYLLGHAEALHGPRLPLDGVLLCYAGLALAALILPRRSGLIRTQ